MPIWRRPVTSHLQPPQPANPSQQSDETSKDNFHSRNADLTAPIPSLHSHCLSGVLLRLRVTRNRRRGRIRAGP